MAEKERGGMLECTYVSRVVSSEWLEGGRRSAKRSSGGRYRGGGRYVGRFN